MKKRILTFLLALCLIVPATFTLTACGGDTGTKGLTYMKVSDGYSVSSIGTATDAEIIIPEKYKGEPVVSIWDEAFQDCTFITSITIPSSVTDIGEAAFDGCTGLKSLTIPNTVTSVGFGVVTNCTALETLTTPIFYTTKISHFFRVADNSDIPESLKTVVLTKGREIAAYAFSGCENLTDIILPSELTEIGEGAFRKCESLTQIRIPASVNEIEASAFFGCYDLAEVYYDGTIESWCNIGFEKGTLGEYGSSNPVRYAEKFYMYEEGTNNAYEVTEIVIPNTITGIGQYQFIGFAIESIVIPTSVIEIDDGAFNLCNNLTNVYYAGTEDQWNNIDGHANAERIGRTITYNYN